MDSSCRTGNIDQNLTLNNIILKQVNIDTKYGNNTIKTVLARCPRVEPIINISRSLGVGTTIIGDDLQEDLCDSDCSPLGILHCGDLVSNAIQDGSSNIVEPDYYDISDDKNATYFSDGNTNKTLR